LADYEDDEVVEPDVGDDELVAAGDVPEEGEDAAGAAEADSFFSPALVVAVSPAVSDGGFSLSE
jgi:hypothetical protein